MKSIIIAGILLSSAGAAVAGPYANIENNSSYVGNDYTSAITEVHAGYEWDNGIYVQGGPAFVSVEGEELQTEYSGKVGISREVTENVELYSEVAFLTEEQSFDTSELNIAHKVGVTFRF